MNIFNPEPEQIPVSELTAAGDSDNELIYDFCSNFDLETSREYLWQLLKLSFTGNLNELTAIEKEDLLHFYEEINVLLEELFKVYDCRVMDGLPEELEV
ncbi:hypothetical protein DBR11_04675 [Pedobacter sp. HMWF019]|uniref:hypothetical protein n=1 Tax=Pedobacter sp. HMWF019 TaxID=2056856 RepID=UPI000D3C592B|nr:hypothetical protein [Pedobacter sp. HMWF019]PTT02474.1 hypothetical protein DBR11_04675 [Pedobacter sp. HMWF019]